MKQIANVVACLIMAMSVGVLYNWHPAIGIAAVVYILAMQREVK